LHLLSDKNAGKNSKGIASSSSVYQKLCCRCVHGKLKTTERDFFDFISKKKLNLTRRFTLSFVILYPQKFGQNGIWKPWDGGFDPHHQSNARCLHLPWGTHGHRPTTNCCGWRTVSRKIICARKLCGKVS